MKKIISACVCLLLCLTLFIYANNFLARKTSYQKNADFYGAQEDFEVLFLGSSHMIMGIAPMELWDDYGITSYNMANYGQYLPVDYWVLKNALDYTTPKLVVIDVFSIDKDAKYSSTHVSSMHEMFDIMPLTRNKLHAIQDLLPEEQHMEFLFPFSFYHSRWSEINSTFWTKPVPSTEKGGNLDYSNALPYAAVSECEEPDWIAHSRKNQTQTVGKDYLEKIITLCQENNIEAALVALPFAPTEEEQLYLNSVQDIADEYNIKYFNMNQTDGYINYSTDMYDEGHLNSSGARKTTAVLG
ncbi:MAG: hypothetical protein K2J99_01710, partial [Lachnospiraceae bacterium]|nr:hypothetical protein [Lachnospiraceae bacterium]